MVPLPQKLSGSAPDLGAKSKLMRLNSSRPKFIFHNIVKAQNTRKYNAYAQLIAHSLNA